SFYDDESWLGDVSLNFGGAAFSTSSLAPGDHHVTARYQGEGNFNASTSEGLTETVSAATTTTSLQSSANPAGYGQAVTFTAAVAPAGPWWSGTPTGAVSFTADGADLGEATLSNGVATLTVSTLTAGDHAVTATYRGGDAF